MPTVRIYKVAELLGLSSREAMRLLKQDTGIDVRSASSSVEEIVARQFVERQARKRQLSLLAGPLFADTPASRKAGKGRKGGKAGRTTKAAPEPPPPAPTRRPRLVKSVKPVVVEAAETPESGSEPGGTAPVTPPDESERLPVMEAAEPAEPGAEDGAPTAEDTVAAAATEGGAAATTPAEETSQPSPAKPEAPRRPAGRLVPPSRRLRIEDPVTGAAPAARPLPLKAPIRPQVNPPAPTKPAAPGQTVVRPAAARPIPPAVRPPLGGPRPLPAQPIRPPGQQVPGRPSSFPPRRPMPYRPWGPRTRSARREVRPPTVAESTPLPPITKLITLAEGTTVKDVADKLEVKAKDVMKKLMERRVVITINSPLETDTATMIAREFGAEVLVRSFEEELTEVEAEASKPEDMIPRAPVVTVMGHVDHGKTTLLDAIRETKVAEREAGGITQHIGAYSVEINDRRIVFLDTPGHEAFTMMRARGAKVTDIVVLVVAADDGVMPQTKEAIDHAKAANVPIIVAVNKIDKADADTDRVKRELADLGLVPEAWGGTTVAVDVSARQRKNLDQLLEMVLLVADIADVKANPKRMAQGTVLEAKLDRGRGPVAHVLVHDGTISEGDLFIAGTVDGKVRALFDHLGHKLKKAGPSTPVEVLGLSSLPQPGDTFQVVDDPIKARQVVTYRQAQAKEKSLFGKGGRLTLESLQQQMADGAVKELAVIVKADVQGSAEVLADTLAKLSDDRVRIRTIHTGVGAINESDVLLATASNAIIIGFNVRPDRNAAGVADREKVDIRLHSIIYQVTAEIKKAMSGLLEPSVKETRLGAAEVRQIFKTPKAGMIAGCLVSDGRIARSGDAQARLVRNGSVVWQGKLASLRRFKDDVSEVRVGVECGIALERFNDIKVGDLIEAFTVERIAQMV